MAISTVADSGLWYVTGVTDTATDRYPLGRLKHEVAGGHFVGYDDSFTDPLIVRAYYDPTQDSRRNQTIVGVSQFVGYVQVAQMNVLGLPVPPDAFGGRWADRAPYVTTEQRFVDFMGPAQAKILQWDGGVLPPFYALNGLLTDGTLVSDSKLARAPLPDGPPNGWLLFPRTLAETSQARCASLKAEVAGSFLTEGTITAMLSARTFLVDIPRSTGNAGLEAYEVALAALSQPNLPLAGVTLDDLAGRVVGRYVLITIANYEAMYPVLCVWDDVASGSPVVRVHLLEDEDIDSMEEVEETQALFNAWLVAQASGASIPSSATTPPPGRGMGGTHRPPIYLPAGRDVLEIRYTTVACSFVPRQWTGRGNLLQPLSGFSWSALFQYDPDERRLRLTRLKAPEPLSTLNLDPVARYLAAVGDAQLNQLTIDTSNFTRARMRRQNLRMGAKLSLISPTGTPLA